MFTLTMVTMDMLALTLTMDSTPVITRREKEQDSENVTGLEQHSTEHPFQRLLLQLKEPPSLPPCYTLLLQTDELVITLPQQTINLLRQLPTVP